MQHLGGKTMDSVEWTSVDEAAFQFVCGFSYMVLGWLCVGGIVDLVGGFLL